MMDRKKRSTLLVIFTFLVILALLPSGVLAGTKSDAGVTLYVPNSQNTCTPKGGVKTTGVPEGGWVIYEFGQYVEPNFVVIESGEVMGNLASAFPYPDLTPGVYIFYVRVDVYNADGTLLTKLMKKWRITCEEKPTPTPLPTKTPMPTPTPTEPPPPTPTPTKPPSRFEGCTPGYWRQAQHYDSWSGYVPGQLFGSVFEDAFPDLALGAVVRLGGGGLNALGRHTVAALLNAASPDVNYAYSVAEVIGMFNDVFPGSTAEYNQLKNLFEYNNELGCPLN
jgi:hypothetical protein